MVPHFPIPNSPFRGKHALVLGDLMLDRYTWGAAERVSPEAPVLVLRADEQQIRPGGAAGVALLLRRLEAQVTLVELVFNIAANRVECGGVMASEFWSAWVPTGGDDVGKILEADARREESWTADFGRLAS